MGREGTTGLCADVGELRRGRLDRLGDCSTAMTAWVFRNPALSIAAATAVLFAIARIPAEIFYSRFGLRPEDVGLNSVQVLLQGATTVLAISLAIAVLYGLFFPLAQLRLLGCRRTALRQTTSQLGALWTCMAEEAVLQARARTGDEPPRAGSPDNPGWSTRDHGPDLGGRCHAYGRRRDQRSRRDQAGNRSPRQLRAFPC